MRKPKVVGLRFMFFGIVFAGLIGLLTYGLWNAVIPAVFGLPAITLWQSLCLLALCRLLFGRIGSFAPGMRKARFVRGLDSLTPEERDRFRNAMGPGCSRFTGPDEPGSTTP